MSRSPRRLIGLALAAGGTALAILGQFLDPNAAAPTSMALAAAIAVSFTAMAAFVLAGAAHALRLISDELGLSVGMPADGVDRVRKLIGAAPPA